MAVEGGFGAGAPPTVHAGLQEPSAPVAAAARRGGALLLVARDTLRQPTGIFGTAVILVWVLVALFAPLLAPFDPNVQHAGVQLLPPGAQSYLLGTDELGRDILSRVIFGARISVSVAFIAVLVGAVVGTVIGLVAGYFRGMLDTVLMRAADIMLAYPGILLGVVVVAVLQAGVVQVAIAIAIINVPIFGRLARAGVLHERELDYVAAAQLAGCSWRRVLFRHILPNAVGPLVVQASLSMAHAVLIEASMSFLGLGAQLPTASWGAMLNESRQYLSQTWSFAIFPGVALATLVLGLNFLADALRSALDPHARGRSR
ncbi:ABC transporter permease [Pseudonocardia sp.]|jgi:ABC-type dipeptide/oligopeptide/nickel transport system permease subunit|uniref:ABC transporter permease n=1 Tax=Pseudonocardia sp. TaxID=60912 RepID=UPI0031FDA069